MNVEGRSEIQHLILHGQINPDNEVELSFQFGDEVKPSGNGPLCSFPIIATPIEGISGLQTAVLQWENDTETLDKTVAVTANKTCTFKIPIAEASYSNLFKLSIILQDAPTVEHWLASGIVYAKKK